MHQAIRPLNMPPRMLVTVSLAILTGVFLFVMIPMLINQDLTDPATSSLLAGGIAFYAAAAALLYRVGVSYVTRLEKLSVADTLCHLPNRRALHSEIKLHLAAQKEIAIAMLDLDGFKAVNDLYGHAVGDKMIQIVARLIDECAGSNANAFRLGGDEFAITMASNTARKDIETICDRLLTSLTQPLAIEERRIAIGVSIGLSTNMSQGHIVSQNTDQNPGQNPGQNTDQNISQNVGSDGIREDLDSPELLRRADVAMYASKHNGRMRRTWFNPDFDQNVETKKNLDEQLRTALENQELLVHYQPIVSSRTGEVSGIEALLRWDRRDGETIGPDIFIPIAEESGLINMIGIHVIEQACQDALAWGQIKLAINLSAAQLRNPEFPADLGRILVDTGFPAHRLELEITEACLTHNLAHIERNLKAIRSFGISIALDDFGTGNASIGYLRRYRFEQLKLDRSLIVEAAGDESSRALMLSSISMAQALKMQVTAEGVETEDQAALARTAGCDQMQGWLFHRAMPAGDFTTRIKTGDIQLSGDLSAGDRPADDQEISR